MADSLRRLAMGEDDRRVEPNRKPKSSSSEVTYPEDLSDPDRIRDEIAGMARDNALWLERKGFDARTVTIKVRYADFHTVTRSHSDKPTHDADAIVRRAVALVEKTDAGRRAVRLLGAGVSNLEPLGGGDEPAGDPPLELDLDSGE
jgi:DNA polymerase-4